MAAADASFFDDYQSAYKDTKEVELSMDEYLELCKTDHSAYANPWERLLKAIGEPQIIDYSKEPKLRNIFEGLAMPRYPAFEDFYGYEEVGKQIVSFIRSAAQGGGESKKILFLMGPVGSAKSSLATRITELMEQEPFYAIKGSPVFDNPLSIFNLRKHGKMLESKFHIDSRYLMTQLSPWALKELKKVGGERNLRIVKLYPSISNQIAISQVSASDNTNKDVSVIVGKVDLSKLEEGLSQHDALAYGYSGALCRGNRGMMEYVEMLKDPIDTLNPLLTATQERRYPGTEAIGALPFEGLILAHTNETEWKTFRADAKNEALLDRLSVVKVPYLLRFTEEEKIYKKLIREGALRHAPCAPGFTEMVATYNVATRLAEPEDKSSLETKMKVYDGERTNDPKAKTLKAYRDEAYSKGHREGMTGWSVRTAQELVSETFNFHAAEGEISASPIDLMFLLERKIKSLDLPIEIRDRYLLIIDKMLKPGYAKTVEKELKAALVESFASYGQNIFERYVAYAELALEDEDDLIDPITKTQTNKKAIIKELEAIEKPAGISNPDGFRNEVVRFVTREQRDHNGKMPDWKSFKKFADAIESKIFSNTKDLMPLISFGPKSSSEEDKKHSEFVDRMVARGYTPRQVQQVTKWFETNKPT